MHRIRVNYQRRRGRERLFGRPLQRRRTRPTVMPLEDRRLMSTFTVCNTADGGSGSLRYEIALANSTPGANTVDFDTAVFSSALTITLTGGPLELNDTTGTETITGPAAGVTIDGDGLSQVIQVAANVTASLSGLTITGGSTREAGAGLANYGGALTLNDCTISGNSAATDGGGLYTNDYGTTTLDNCTISGNSASVSGGGLDSYEGTTTLADCTVSGNSASENGGGLCNYFGSMTLDNCTITGNFATGHGGGLYDFVGTTTMNNVSVCSNFAQDGGGVSIFFGTTTLSDCTFSGDVAFTSGGGVYSNAGTNTLADCTLSGDTASRNGGGLINSYGTATLTNCTVSGNSASESGGGIYSNWASTSLSGCTIGGNAAGANGGGLAGSNDTTTLADCTFSGNVAYNGGGLYNLKSTFTLSDVIVSRNVAYNGGGLSTAYGTTSLSGCTVSGNSASASGGGAFNDSGTTTLVNSTLSGDSASVGGGVSTYQYGTTALTNCTVSGNSASQSGGGVDTKYSTSTLTNCTVSGNSAGSGGGLYTDDYGSSALINCTVSGNSAGSGGGLDNSQGTVKIGNTIVAENTATTAGPDAIGTFASLGNNLIGETNGSFGWVGSDLTGTSGDRLNALLASLGNYGGPTQTMALLPGSLAIDAGNNGLIPAGVITDQRGLPRIVGGVVDIGAFESSLFTITVISGSGQSTGISTAFSAPLVATVTANNPIEPVAGGLVAFTPPQSGASATLSGSPATINANGTVSVGATANGVVGTYTVVAGARGITNTASFNLTNQAIPTITTTPTMTTVALGTAPVTLMDTAVLSNGYYETGTITFTMYLGSTLLDTETVAVSGNGSYATPTGYTLPTTGTVTGTYQWDASYSGDTYNTPASENNAAAEQVVVNSASPSMTTTPSANSITLGTSLVTLTDTASLSGGYYETGTITFTLYQGSTLVDTETVAVSGIGSYSTPTGYTLPTTGTATGSYQWDASYSGDSNNNSTSENNATAEQVTVSPASPTITTTPSVSDVTLGTSPATLNDTAVLSGGYYETGTITFTLYHGSALVDTETVAINGNGSYSTPTGYTLPTTGTATGSYHWDASYSGDSNNTSTSENNAAAEQVAVSPATPSITTTPSATAVTLGTAPTTLKDTAVLSGGYYETGTITFTLYHGSTLVDTETVAVSGNGSYSTPTGYTLPTTGTVTGSYQWDASYSGDSNNTSTSENNAAAEQVAVSPASPTITTTPSVSTVTLGTSPATLNDTAVLSGGYYETGTITFTLYQGSTLVDTETVAVSGNGSYSTPTGYTLPTTGTATGSYQWDASYSGDSNNNSTSENNATAEQVTVSPASPTITTTPSVSAVTLGTSPLTLNDTAVLSGGYYETGTITFTLYHGSALVDTETVAINGNGTYSTPTGYTLPPVETVTGTYQWDASYSGDSNNTSTSENNAAAEQVAVSPATPSITTTPSATAVTLGTPPPTLKDTAVLSGGYYETGTITFTLYQGSTLVDTATVAVSGNGTYTTPTGYTLPTIGNVTGTYQWNASYSGDSNDTSTSENNASAEQTVVSPANPSLVTTASSAITLGTTAPTITDAAVLSSGYLPDGLASNITFTLKLGSSTVYTTTDAVSGNGSYSASYTLPTTGVVTGTYTWSAQYGGDPDNDSAHDQGGTSEQTTVSPASPNLITTPSPTTVTLGATSATISGTKFLDPTGSGFTSADTPQSGVTIDLYEQVGSSVPLVATTTTAANGTYSFTVAPGTYFLYESVPSSYIQTGGGPNGSTGDAYYTIVATGGHSYSGYNFADYLIPTCTPTNISYKVTTPNNCSTTVTDLGGNTQQGDTVTANFTVPSGMNDTLTLVSYIAPGPSFSDATAYQQVIYDQQTGTFAPGTHSLTVTIPNCDYQIDFVCGSPITQLEPNQNDNAYGPDSADILYHAQGRFISSDNGGITAPNPMPAPSASPTTPNPTSTSSLSSNLTLADTAVLSGGYYETGTITFTLSAPNGTTVDTETVAVSGNGTYTTPAGYTLSGTSATGTYQWNASFLDTDGNNLNASDNSDAAERVAVSGSTISSPSLGTTPGGTVTIGSGTKLTDSAILSGGSNPSGTITFYLFAPGITPNGTDGNNVYCDTVTVSGNGTYSTSMGNNPGGYTPTAAGTFEWVAVYSGDSKNSGVTSPFGSEAETVTASPVCAGQFATIGFWQTRSGQNVINSCNGSSSATALGNWLANNFPNLFGTSNQYIASCLRQYGATCFAGLSNAQIACIYQNLSNPSGTTENTYVQALAAALGIYADTSTLGGSSTAKQCGFQVTAAGGGPATFNVGNNGAAFSVVNNTTLSVLNILQTLNKNFSPSSGSFCGNSQALTSAANNVLNGINTTGDITNSVSLSASGGTVAYTPAQIRAAYGINSLSEDGTGQTIAIVDAYDDPNIFEAVDAFDLQFGLTDSGPSLAAQYGPATSFLTVLNQSGQTAPLPGTDPSGPGTDNWEVEESLDVEWAHAIAPGAQIILVEANSQSLSDLMAAVSTASSQPGVSVVSMSWGFPEGQAVFAGDEATYDNVFNVPSVTFLASTGDYGVADAEYPAFSPNVVAVGGTSLSLNADNSYNSETGWGYYSDSLGMSIGSGGGLSLYESEPAYQQGVQSTGRRTTPDVSFVADPATGAWIADPYNLGVNNPFEVVGGTSLAAPAWAGLITLANQGREAVGEATLNTSGSTEIQQALYSLPQSDYNVINSGSNGYTANAGYNLVTGLGTPITNLLVPDLIAYQGPGTTYAGPTVGALQDATLVNNWSSGGGTSNDFTIFDAISESSSGLDYAQVPDAASTTSTPTTRAPMQNLLTNQWEVTAVVTSMATLTPASGSFRQTALIQPFGAATSSTFVGQTSPSPTPVAIAPISTSLGTQAVPWSISKAAASASVKHLNPEGWPVADSEGLDRFILSQPRTRLVADAILDELATDSALWRFKQASGTITLAVRPTRKIAPDPTLNELVPVPVRSQPPADYAAGLAALGVAAGVCARGTPFPDPRKRRSGRQLFRALPSLSIFR